MSSLLERVGAFFGMAPASPSTHSLPDRPPTVVTEAMRWRYLFKHSPIASTALIQLFETTIPQLLDVPHTACNFFSHTWAQRKCAAEQSCYVFARELRVVLSMQGSRAERQALAAEWRQKGRGIELRDAEWLIKSDLLEKFPGYALPSGSRTLLKDPTKAFCSLLQRSWFAAEAPAPIETALRVILNVLQEQNHTVPGSTTEEQLQSLAQRVKYFAPSDYDIQHNSKFSTALKTFFAQKATWFSQITACDPIHHPEAWLPPLSQFPHLQTLSYPVSRVTNLAALCTTIGQISSLTSLTFIRDSNSVPLIQLPLDALSTLRLTELRLLSRAASLTPAEAAYLPHMHPATLADGLTPMPHSALEVLEYGLGPVLLYHQDPLAFTREFPRLRELTLYFHENQFAHSQISHTIESLTLRGIGTLSKDCFLPLQQIVSLRTLQVEAFDVLTVEHAKSIASLQALTTLELNMNNFEPGAFTALQPLADNLLSLTLSLGSATLLPTSEGRGFSEIVSLMLLCQGRELRELTLRGLLFTEFTISVLIPALKAHTKLERLTLIFSKFPTEEQDKELRKTFAHLLEFQVYYLSQ